MKFKFVQEGKILGYNFKQWNEFNFFYINLIGFFVVYVCNKKGKIGMYIYYKYIV